MQPTQWKQQCDGFATYRWYPDTGAIEVKDVGFPSYGESHSRTRNVLKFYEKYGALLQKHADALGLPIAWVVAIVSIESGGNEWACSPCISHDSKGKQICSLAPDRCGGGVAKDGKHYVCCAYGLMQVINRNAVSYGKKHGAELLGDPDESIRIGVSIYRSNIKSSEGDPLVAVRRYNGCGVKICVGGRVTQCSPACMFGIGGQGQGGVSYAEIFSHVTNTFIALHDKLPVPKQPPGEIEPVLYEAGIGSPGILGLSLAIGLGLGAYWYASRKDW